MYIFTYKFVYWDICTFVCTCVFIYTSLSIYVHIYPDIYFYLYVTGKDKKHT